MKTNCVISNKMKWKREKEKDQDMTNMSRCTQKLSHINKQTNHWTIHDQSALNIAIEDADNENDIVDQIAELDDVYNKLALTEWDRDKFLLFNPAKYSYDRQVMTKKYLTS